MEYEKLCRAVEQALHRQLKTPKDFDYASERVTRKTHETISPTTLMRLWGYRKETEPRPSTLDILARFIGYEDYTQFLIAQEQEEVEKVADNTPDITPTTETELISPAPKRHWPWVVAASIVLALIIVGGIYLYLHRPLEPQEPVYITSIEQLSNDRQYFIHTRNGKRGTLGMDSHQLATTYTEAHYYRCDTASTFALIRYEDSYYLYSVQRHRFINVLFAETDDPLQRSYAEKNWCAIDVHIEEGYFVFDFWADHLAGKVFTLNVNSGNGLIITDWGTMNSVYDDGNLFMIEDAGPFDPTEALEALRRSKEKNADK